MYNKIKEWNKRNCQSVHNLYIHINHIYVTWKIVDHACL